MLKIWFVDDMKSNQVMWKESFPAEVLQNNQFRVFSTVQSLFSVADAGELPDILFIDYYIGDDFGHEVVDYFLKCRPKPFLVAHSSAFAANQAMVKQGADIMLEKKPGKPYTVSIAKAVKNQSDLLTWVKSNG